MCQSCRGPYERERSRGEGGGAETVVIVEDDISVREALSGLLQSVGLQVKAFASPVNLLGNGQLQDASCMVVDIRLPGMSGLAFQAALAQAGINTPVILHDRARRRADDGKSHESRSDRRPDQAVH